MSGSTGYTYSNTGQVVPTQSLAYLVQQLRAAQAAQNQSAQAGGTTGGAQTTPQATSASGTPSAATGGGGSPAGAVAAPQQTPAQETQTIEQYLSGTAYPDIQSQIMAAYQRAVEGGAPTAGVLHGAPPMGVAGLPLELTSAASPFLSLAGLGLGPAAIPIEALSLLGHLYTEKAPTLTATDAPWAGGSKGYATGEGGLGGLVSLPDPSASAGGATGQLAQQLGGGLGEAYPWGAGAPYTAGSGIYQFAPQMEPPGAAGTTQTAGNPAFFMPGSEPNTFYQTDYFGNVISGPHNMSGTGTAPTGDRPLGLGAQEPGWLQQAFASDPAIAPGQGVGWAQAWGTQPTSQQLSGWGVASTTPDRGGAG